jgi:hypothetical protein
MMNELLMDLRVHVTTEYSNFSFIDGNRVVNKANLKKLLESMSEEQLIIPIIVNEKFQIIDGQHRFIAAKELNKPVFYIVNYGYGIEQVKRANTVGTNWTNEDFLKTYVAEYDENYIKINELRKEKGLQISSILKITAAFQGQGYPLILNRFQNGELQVNRNNEWSGILHFCKQLELFSDYRNYKTNSFINAFLKLYHYEDYDPSIMERQAKWIVNFQPNSNTCESILDEFCRSVYSYRLSRNKIYYDKKMRRFFK